MERSWYWRVALIVAVTLFSLWQLVPSWFYFKLPPEERLTEAYERAIPGWAPHSTKHLNLGLDLQGGIHLAMGVDVDRAVKAKVARRADEIAEFLKAKNVPFESSTTAAGRHQDRGEDRRAGPGEGDRPRAGYGDEMYSPGTADGAVTFAFKDTVLRDFQGKAVEQAEKTIRNRVDKWGVTEPDIKRKANNQIQIQLPGFKDPEKAKELLGRTAQLEFKIADDENPALDPLRQQLTACAGPDGFRLPLPEGGCWTTETIELPNGGARAVTMLAANTRPELEKLIQEKAAPLLDPQKNVIGIGEDTVTTGVGRTPYYRTYLLRAKTELTGDYIADARAAIDNSQQFGQQGRPLVQFTMSAEGGRLMEKLTTENMRRRMATVLDDKVETRAVHPGRDLHERSDHARLRSQRAGDVRGGERDRARAQGRRAPRAGDHLRGAHRRRDARARAREAGTVAALVGLGLVLLFMVFYYRGSGLVADVALALNGLLVLAIMSMIGTTLTLPGIAGFVLTLGMAVDANVLINERIREELRAGKSVKQAVQQGYDKVFWTIVDSHVTTLVAALVLMNYGSGPVRGFAVTLIIGLVASMFTSIVVTRAIMEYTTRHETARLSV